MDIERVRRQELIGLLGDDFRCYEEVRLRHALFRNFTVRSDVVAIPADERLASYALAFEVKEPKADWQEKHWLHAMRQASDYVYAEIEPQKQMPASAVSRRRIAAAFLFPSPPMGLTAGGARDFLSGAMLLALHFRVGRAHHDRKHTDRFLLSFGPNDVWRSNTGFTAQGLDLLTGKRPLGSQRVDVLQALGGFS